MSSGMVRVKLYIRSYIWEVSLLVTDISPGFDVFLGEAWNRRNGVVADHGHETDETSIEPSLWLRHSRS